MINFIKKGFTLIELLIVVAIIGILTALVTTNLQSVRQRARDTRRKSDIRAVQQSLRLYYNDAKQFPTSNTEYQIEGCGTSPCSWGSPFATTTTTYMGSLPLDPLSTSTDPIEYRYFSNSDDQYAIVTSLENKSDLDIADSQSRCLAIYGIYKSVYTSYDIETDYVACAQ